MVSLFLPIRCSSNSIIPLSPIAILYSTLVLTFSKCNIIIAYLFRNYKVLGSSENIFPKREL